MHPGVGVGVGWGGVYSLQRPIQGGAAQKGYLFLGFNERVDIIFTTVVEV